MYSELSEAQGDANMCERRNEFYALREIHNARSLPDSLRGAVTVLAGVLACCCACKWAKTHNDKIGALEADRPWHVLPRLEPHQNTASHMLPG